MIVIVDYGMGNSGSLLNMLKKIRVNAIISSHSADIERADKLILPGIGSFDSGMKNIHDLGLLSVLHKKVLHEKTPILGVCLGMQLFTKGSEEGSDAGFGWIDAETVRFDFSNELEKLKIPHVGWNTVLTGDYQSLFKGLEGETRFYFTHSYYLICRQEEDILATTYYGYNFVSAVQRNNIFGTQFHPEKSHKFGMQILKNFVEFF